MHKLQYFLTALTALLLPFFVNSFQQCLPPLAQKSGFTASPVLASNSRRVFESGVGSTNFFTTSSNGDSKGPHLQIFSFRMRASEALHFICRDTLIPLDWQVLRDVQYKRKYHAEYDEYFEYPIFGPKVRAIEGKKIEIQGYIIPLGGGVYALSKNPYAACFFCGGAGPETVIGLNFSKTPKRLRVDDYLRVRGIFHLNDTDVDQFMYQLNAAEIAP